MQADTQMVAKTKKPKAGSGVKTQSEELRKQGVKSQGTCVEEIRLSQGNN